MAEKHARTNADLIYSVGVGLLFAAIILSPALITTTLLTILQLQESSYKNVHLMGYIHFMAIKTRSKGI